MELDSFTFSKVPTNHVESLTLISYFILDPGIFPHSVFTQVESVPYESRTRMSRHIRLPLIYQPQPRLFRFLEANRKPVELFEDLLLELRRQFRYPLPTLRQLVRNLIEPPVLLLRRHIRCANNPDSRINQEQR